MLKHAVWMALACSLACSAADRRPAAGTDGAGKTFDHLEIETPASEKHAVCFDITNFFGKY